jgi:hypothetical protein
MGFSRELVEQRRGVIPRRVGVVAQSCNVKALNAQMSEQERWCRVREGPRARRSSPEGAFSPLARRTSPEGVFSPRARWTSPEGAFSLAALAGRGGHQGRDRVAHVFWLRGLVCVCIFYEIRWGSPRCLGDP